AGKWKKYVTDAMNHLTQVIEPDSGASGPVPFAVYGTGVLSSGALAGDGSVDAHYSLISSPDPAYPGPNTVVINSGGRPSPSWLYNVGASKWIGPRSDAGNGSAPGNYTYRTTFDLTGLNPSTAALTGRYAADDTAIIKLNGVTVVSSSQGFTAFQSF